jgi:filamentous hemagglutinin
MGAGVSTAADGSITTIIASSEPGTYLRPGVTLSPGEVVAGGLGHAEEKIVDYAQANGIIEMAIGAGRPICGPCASIIQTAGYDAVTELKH